MESMPGGSLRGFQADNHLDLLPQSQREESLSGADVTNSGEQSDDNLTAQALNPDGTPKRPMNAFLLYAKKRRPQISTENPTMRTGEISKILSKEWQDMEKSDKVFYQGKAKKLKDRFNARWPDYVYRRRPNNSKKRRRGASPDSGLGHDRSYARGSELSDGGHPEAESGIDDDSSPATRVELDREDTHERSAAKVYSSDSLGSTHATTYSSHGRPIEHPVSVQTNQGGHHQLHGAPVNYHGSQGSGFSYDDPRGAHSSYHSSGSQEHIGGHGQHGFHMGSEQNSPSYVPYNSNNSRPLAWSANSLADRSQYDRAPPPSAGGWSSSSDLSATSQWNPRGGFSLSGAPSHPSSSGWQGAHPTASDAVNATRTHFPGMSHERQSTQGSISPGAYRPRTASSSPTSSIRGPYTSVQNTPYHSNGFNYTSHTSGTAGLSSASSARLPSLASFHSSHAQGATRDSTIYDGTLPPLSPGVPQEDRNRAAGTYLPAGKPQNSSGGFTGHSVTSYSRAGESEDSHTSYNVTDERDNWDALRIHNGVPASD